MLDLVQTATNLIGTAEVAEIFGVDRSTVTRWVSAGKLEPFHASAGGLLFERTQIERLAGSVS